METSSEDGAEERDEPEERPDALSPGFVTGLALQRAGGSDDDDARALLREQARVLHIQAEHLHEQREVQLSHLKARRISEWMKVVLQALTVTVGILVAATVVGLIVGAVRSRSVVVEAFDAPPALAARGETGKVVANGLLDALTRLQAATRVTAAKRRLAGAWAGDIKVEVPETGVSIGELKRLLHEMLGQDLHVDGDLVQTATGGLTLTVRADGVLPQAFTGGAGDLEALTTKAAEYIYGAVDPYLLADYLSNAGRTADALSFLAKAYPQAPAAEQPELLNQWGNALFDLGRQADAAAKYRTAVEIRPDFWKAWGNLVLALEGSEGEEAAFRSGTQMVAAERAHGQYDANPTSRDAFDTLVQDWPGDYADLTWDMRMHGGGGTSSSGASADLALVEAERHDWDAAERDLNGSDPDDPSTTMNRASVEARRAMEAGDAQTAIARLEPALKTYDSDTSIRVLFPTVPCDLGLAYAQVGRLAEGLALMARGGRWVSCYSLKGDALAAAGDRAGATAAYHAAIALAPNLPYAYQRYGLTLLRQHDPSAAAVQFAAAHARGPHWADPLKAWGDALVALSRRRDAADKYDEALRYDPNWAELRSARRGLASQ